jgi:alpha-methylacyl-CoA racemase
MEHATRPANGPLVGIRVVELGGIGPVPFAGMLLSDLGADVVRIDRPAGFDGGAPVDPRFDVTRRGRRSISLDLKLETDRDQALALIEQADVAIEGFRPGVAERLGLGPDDCAKRNPRLIYGRMTGWGQDGPLAASVGHDINYVSIAGALHAVGRADEPPAIPLNLVGDLGGGALYLVVGVLAALHESRHSGTGQVVDAAMVDGTVSLLALYHGLVAEGYWKDARGVNRLDSGAPFYNVYETADGQWISIAANEARFWRNLLELLELDQQDLPQQHDREHWPATRDRFAVIFGRRTRAEWIALAEGRDVCMTPVLSLTEAPSHPHLKHRNTFVEVDGIVQPAPAPRFSRTPGAIQGPPPHPGDHTDQILADWGITPASPTTSAPTPSTTT